VHRASRNMAEVGRFRSEVMCRKHANNSVQLIKCSAEIGRFANISIGIEGASACSASAMTGEDIWVSRPYGGDVQTCTRRE